MDPRRRARILEKIQRGTATRKERLYLKQEGLCFYCWTDLGADVTEEHLEARALGGTSQRVNLRVAHMACNGVVGSLPVDQKLDLHEVGRDKGADAFWQRARELQRQNFGPERKAYARKSKKSVLKNANRHAAREETHDLTVQEARQESGKLDISRKADSGPHYSKTEKSIMVAEEIRRRKDAEEYDRMTFALFYRWLDQHYPRGYRREAA